MSKNEKKPAHDTLHVGLLIDESGSMGPKHGAVIGGTTSSSPSSPPDQNGTKVLATLGMFDLHGNDPVVRVKFEDIPVAEVGMLGPDDYAPRGATPLNDAVAQDDPLDGQAGEEGPPGDAGDPHRRARELERDVDS